MSYQQQKVRVNDEMIRSLQPGLTSTLKCDSTEPLTQCISASVGGTVLAELAQTWRLDGSSKTSICQKKGAWARGKIQSMTGDEVGAEDES